MDYTPTIRPAALQLLSRARNAAEVIQRRRHDMLCGLALSGLALYVAAWAPIAFTQWAFRDNLRREARLAVDADYDAVMRAPAAYVGRSVRWPLMWVDGQGWFYRGDPSRPVRWTRRPPHINTYRQAVAVVASVTAVDTGGVTLSYRGIVDGPQVLIKLPS